jgi:hypothetical protein
MSARDPTPGAMITIREARRLVNSEMVHRILVQDRHHHDDAGEPWWHPAEWDGAVALAEFELDGEGGHRL